MSESIHTNERFAAVRESIYRSPAWHKLTKGDINVYLALALWGDKGSGTPFRSHDELQSDTGYTRKGIKKALKHLSNLGFITMIEPGRRGHSTVYRLEDADNLFEGYSGSTLFESNNGNDGSHLGVQPFPLGGTAVPDKGNHGTPHQRVPENIRDAPENAGGTMALTSPIPTTSSAYAKRENSTGGTEKNHSLPSAYSSSDLIASGGVTPTSTPPACTAKRTRGKKIKGDAVQGGISSLAAKTMAQKEGAAGWEWYLRRGAAAFDPAVVGNDALREALPPQPADWTSVPSLAALTPAQIAAMTFCASAYIAEIFEQSNPAWPADYSRILRKAGGLLADIGAERVAHIIAICQTHWPLVESLWNYPLEKRTGYDAENNPHPAPSARELLYPSTIQAAESVLAYSPEQRDLLMAPYMASSAADDFESHLAAPVAA